MVLPLRDIKAFGAAVAQNAREEILQGEADWAAPAITEVVVIDKLGIYGAVTATFQLQKGRVIISEEGSVCDATAFGNNWDALPDVNMVLRGGEKLKLYMTDSAADPLGITVAVLGKVIQLG
jgi:hypothetical protein